MGTRVLLAIGALLAACTFPDVEYRDGGAACSAPMSCVTNASSCAESATKEHEMCDHQCKPSEPACPGECDDARTTALGVCAAACDSCAADECGSEATNCAALVGL